MLLQLVDCAHYSVALKFLEFVPNDSISFAHCVFYDSLLINFVLAIFEETLKSQKVHEGSLSVTSH
jgi:hypothetical protein